MLGKKNWEEAESELQSRTAGLVIEKSGLSKEEIRYSFAGDLLAQLIATSFGNINLEIPMFGLYGACSTMGEGLGLGAMCVEGGFADHVLVGASSISLRRRSSSVFRWNMGIRGRIRLHGR